jgi:hypothetical protein
VPSYRRPIIRCDLCPTGQRLVEPAHGEEVAIAAVRHANEKHHDAFVLAANDVLGEMRVC